MPLKVAVVVGSIRKESINRKLAKAVVSSRLPTSNSISSISATCQSSTRITTRTRLYRSHA